MVIPLINSDTTIKILPFLPICKKIDHLVIPTQHFQFVFLQNLVVRFCYNLGQNKNLEIGESNRATYQRHLVYQKALKWLPRARWDGACCIPPMRKKLSFLFLFLSPSLNF